MKIVGLIPVRLESERLPNKALLKISEIPMILHVAKRAQLSQTLDRLAVCTDSYKICEMCVENEILKRWFTLMGIPHSKLNYLQMSYLMD